MEEGVTLQEERLQLDGLAQHGAAEERRLVSAHVRAVAARDAVAVLDAAEEVVDEALQHLVDEEEDVLRAQAVHAHQHRRHAVWEIPTEGP